MSGASDAWNSRNQNTGGGATGDQISMNTDPAKIMQMFGGIA